MSRKYDRPAFILAFMADTQGCGFQRIQVPLASLADAGLADGRIDTGLWPDDMIVAAQADVIVWQRPVDGSQIELMRRMKARLPNTLFVYELDDYLGGIPEASFHAGFMPPGIPDAVAEGAKICDRISVTTEPLANWFRELGLTDVRVVPNGVARGHIKERKVTPAGGRLRIGFAGGISHGGDLELLRQAMEEIGDDVQWVFMGMKPENAPVRIEFHEGVPPIHYAGAFHALNLDLVLAPLEFNRFNECKSNLRLIEAGANGACVIAQDIDPYWTSRPPVFSYARTPSDWTNAIRAFMKTTQAERQRNADALQSWTARHFTLERLLSARVRAWLPDDYDWKPVAGPSEGVPLRAEEGKLLEMCEKARTSRQNVLWFRAGTEMQIDHILHGLQSTVNAAADIAAAVPLASDGPNAFPKTDMWLPIPVSAAKILDGLLADMVQGKRLKIAAVSGPCALLSGSALSMLGYPDVEGCGGHEEQAILEWSLRACARGWRVIQAADLFAAAQKQPVAPTQATVHRLQTRGLVQGLQAEIETLTAEERSSIELGLLKAQWAGPRPGSMGFDTSYESWRALRKVFEQRGHFTLPEIGNDDDSYIKEPVNRALYGDSLVNIEAREDVSAAVLGDLDGWLVVADEKTEIFDSVYACLSRALPESAEVIYFDHETKIGSTGKCMPEFKPDFDLELFLAQDYISPVCAIRVSALGDSIPVDAADMYARLLDIALNEGREAFQHIPIIGGQVVFNASPEEAAIEVLHRQVAIQQKIPNAQVKAHPSVMGCVSIVRDCPSTKPLVSIVIPTLGEGKLIQPCVNTLRQNTDYDNYEIIVVQNGARAEPELTQTALDDPRVKVVRYDDAEPGFNWAKLNNRVIREHARGAFIVTYNDDVTAVSKNWLCAMLGQAKRPEVGAVGARLVHPSGVLQHVGVIVQKGAAGHMHIGLANGQPGHLGRAILTHEATAVTGACMMFSRTLFNVLDGFDEAFAHNYNDVDFCLRLRKLGYVNIVEMAAEMIHAGSATRTRPEYVQTGSAARKERALLATKHGDNADPYWNSNLAYVEDAESLVIQGTNADALTWVDFQAAPSAKRVLLVNDLPGEAGMALTVLRQNNVPMAADLSEFKLKLVSPGPLNVAPWDIRDPKTMADGLGKLGIQEIRLRSLIGSGGPASPIESLKCLAKVAEDIGAAIVLDQAKDAVLAPGDEKAGDRFGFVDTESWQRAYTAIVSQYEKAGEIAK